MKQVQDGSGGSKVKQLGHLDEFAGHLLISKYLGPESIKLLAIVGRNDAAFVEKHPSI